MAHPKNGLSVWATLLSGAVAAGCAWFAAFAVEAATRLMAGLFAQFGGDLPAPTHLALNAVQSYAPWIMAAAGTLILVYLGMRASTYFHGACTVVAAAAAALASCVALALVLPLMKCGIAWPEWPQATAQPSSPSGKAPTASLTPNSPKGTSPGSCS